MKVRLAMMLAWLAVMIMIPKKAKIMTRVTMIMPIIAKLRVCSNCSEVYAYSYMWFVCIYN